MKKLTLLLTSLLLATGANAGITDFETITDTAPQNVEIAHVCTGWYQHMGGGHKHGIVAHKETAYCVHRDNIDKCRKANRVVNMQRTEEGTLDEMCGKTCPLGQKTGRHNHSYKCIPEDCPEWTVWQPRHLKCVPVGELIAYCKSLNKQYNHATRDCFTCPAGSFPQDSGCRTLGELNAYCASTNSAFVYGVAQDACVSVFDLRKYCREEFDKGYNKDTAKCEVCPVDHFPQESGCVSKAKLDEYCQKEYGTQKGIEYNAKEDRCVRPRELY